MNKKKTTPTAKTLMPRSSNHTRRPSPLYKPGAGCHINNACEEATKLAVENGSDVRFRFNDIELVATARIEARQLAKCYGEESERRSEEYRQSPEGTAAATRRAKEITEKQNIISALLLKLPITLANGSLDKAIEWLKQFTNPSDDIGVKFDKKGVAQTFTAYGYKENYGVGEKPEWFNTRERMGLYIIGQAINCLRSGMPPHGITYTFIEKYCALPVSSVGRPAGKSVPAEGENKP